MKSARKILSLPPIYKNNINNNNNSPKKIIPKNYRGSTINTTHTDNKVNQIKTVKIQPLKKIIENNYNDSTKSYIDDMKKGSNNILVCVRCRPLSLVEKQLSSNETIRIMDGKLVVLIDPIEYNGHKDIFKNRAREQTYAFDYAFDKNCSQYTVYEKSTKFLIDGVVNGFNATVFAYGATGAGKTYTMTGNVNNPGIMPLALKELFSRVNSFNDREYKLKFWYLEIYNENIRDLLKFMKKNRSSGNLDISDNNLSLTNNEYLDLREDPVKGIVVSGITEINVNNSNDMLNILKRGNRNRTQEATGANETSSRSHAILQVSIEYKDKNTGIDIEIKYSKLSLIDLAGSERASATQNRGMRLIEGANINRSLLTLGNCINALCDASLRGNKKVYIPYRDSKLTRLLKDSLGGNSRTVMIANISPGINTFEDTYNTLKYANRAKNIKTFVTRNVLSAQYHISNYVTIINNLKNEVAQLKQQLQLKEGEKNNSSFNTDNFGKNIHKNNVSNKITNNNTYYNQENQKPIKRNISSENYKNKNETNLIEPNNNNNNEFKNAVKELKNACDAQVLTKQKIIAEQSELNKINDNSNSKYINIQKNININKNKYKDISHQIEKIYNENSAKTNFSEFQKDYLTLIMKNSGYKIQILDNKYNNMINLSQNDIKEEYINELENQIKFRDQVIFDNNININLNQNIKTLELLKDEYSSKRKTQNEFKKIIVPSVSQYPSFTNDLSHRGINNNAKEVILFSKKKNNHLDNMRKKFSANNNHNTILSDNKINNNISSYKIIHNNDDKTKTNSPINSNKISHINNNIYSLYKFSSNQEHI